MQKMRRDGVTRHTANQILNLPRPAPNSNQNRSQVSSRACPPPSTYSRTPMSCKDCSRLGLDLRWWFPLQAHSAKWSYRWERNSIESDWKYKPCKIRSRAIFKQFVKASKHSKTESEKSFCLIDLKGRFVVVGEYIGMFGWCVLHLFRRSLYSVCWQPWFHFLQQNELGGKYIIARLDTTDSLWLPGHLSRWSNPCRDLPS